MENIKNTEQELNTYKNQNEDTIYSNTDINLTDYNSTFSKRTGENITLVNYNDFIEKKGAGINKCTQKNYGNEEVPSDFLLDANTTYQIYGHPDKWILDYKQKYNNCGIVSMLNILAIAGRLGGVKRNPTSKGLGFKTKLKKAA